MGRVGDADLNKNSSKGNNKANALMQDADKRLRHAEHRLKKAEQRETTALNAEDALKANRAELSLRENAISASEARALAREQAALALEKRFHRLTATTSVGGVAGRQVKSSSTSTQGAGGGVERIGFGVGGQKWATGLQSSLQLGSSIAIASPSRNSTMSFGMLPAGGTDGVNGKSEGREARLGLGGVMVSSVGSGDGDGLAVDARERQLEAWSQALADQAGEMKGQALSLEAAFDELRKREAEVEAKLDESKEQSQGHYQDHDGRIRGDEGGVHIKESGVDASYTNDGRPEGALPQGGTFRGASYVGAAATTVVVAAAPKSGKVLSPIRSKATATGAAESPALATLGNHGDSFKQRSGLTVEDTRMLERETVRLAEKARELDVERRRLEVAAEAAERDQARAQAERQEAFDARKDAAKLRLELERERTRLDAEKGGLEAEKSLLAAERGRLKTERARNRREDRGDRGDGGNSDDGDDVVAGTKDWVEGIRGAQAMREGEGIFFSAVASGGDGGDGGAAKVAGVSTSEASNRHTVSARGRAPEGRESAEPFTRLPMAVVTDKTSTTNMMPVAASSPKQGRSRIGRATPISEGIEQKQVGGDGSSSESKADFGYSSASTRVKGRKEYDNPQGDAPKLTNTRNNGPPQQQRQPDPLGGVSAGPLAPRLSSELAHETGPTGAFPSPQLEQPTTTPVGKSSVVSAGRRDDFRYSYDAKKSARLPETVGIDRMAPGKMRSSSGAQRPLTTPVSVFEPQLHRTNNESEQLTPILSGNNASTRQGLHDTGRHWESVDRHRTDHRPSVESIRRKLQGPSVRRAGSGGAEVDTSGESSPTARPARRRAGARSSSLSSSTNLLNQPINSSPPPPTPVMMAVGELFSSEGRGQRLRCSVNSTSSVVVSRTAAAAAAAAIAAREEDPFLAKLHARLAGADHTLRESLGRREALLSRFGHNDGSSLAPTSEGDSSIISASVGASPEATTSSSSSPAGGVLGATDSLGHAVQRRQSEEALTVATKAKNSAGRGDDDGDGDATGLGLGLSPDNEEPRIRRRSRFGFMGIVGTTTPRRLLPVLKEGEPRHVTTVTVVPAESVTPASSTTTHTADTLSGTKQSGTARVMKGRAVAGGAVRLALQKEEEENEDRHRHEYRTMVGRSSTADLKSHHTPAKATELVDDVSSSSSAMGARRKGGEPRQAVAAPASDTDDNDTETEKDNLRELMRALGPVNGEGDADVELAGDDEEETKNGATNMPVDTRGVDTRVTQNDDRRAAEINSSQKDMEQGSEGEGGEIEHRESLTTGLMEAGEADAGGGDTLMSSLHAQNYNISSPLQDMSLQVRWVHHPCL